jgi:hypothetical protein
MMRTRHWHWTRKSARGGTLKRGEAARGGAAWPKVQGRALSPRMAEWGSVVGSPGRRRSRGRERIHYSTLEVRSCKRGRAWRV